MRKNNVEEIRKKFPAGARVRLLHMDDIQAVPSGTVGIVKFVDDIGQVHLAWETGSTLALIPGEDKYKILD